VFASQNFNFAFFELQNLDPSITRSPLVTIRVWARRQGTWIFLLDEDVDLRALNWLGTLHNTKPPPNAIIFHLVDGVYSLDLSKKYPPPKPVPPVATSSYNALMKLATLDNSIQDAIAVRDALADQINKILEKEPCSLANTVAAAREKTTRVQKMADHQQRAVDATRRRTEDLRASNAARRAAIAAGRTVQEKVAHDVEHAREPLRSSKEQLIKTQEAIHGQRRRICEDLMQIYRIMPVDGGPLLAFSICGVHLPNSRYEATLPPLKSTSGSHAKTDSPLMNVNEDTVSAALGHVVRLTHSLQFFLGVPLPYPLTPWGSRSSVRDDISKLPGGDAAPRDFPLYLPRGGGGSGAQYPFDYAWFLLNKNIEALCASQGLKVVDIRHTLPNLKYLLYVCSAGTDELPERKKGGVRGLWAGRKSTLVILKDDDDTSSLGGGDGRSRAGSVDSQAGGRPVFDGLVRAVVGRNAKANGNGNSADRGRADGRPAKDDLSRRADDDDGGIRVPFAESETKLTLRTKGLRER
jgi:hypothetical protein